MGSVLRSDFPSPQVHLPSGEVVQFVDHFAKASAAVAKEVLDHADDPAMAELNITRASKADAAAALGESDDASQGDRRDPVKSDGDPPDYDAMGWAELQAEVANRDIEVPKPGSGKNGAHNAADLREALRAADRGQAKVGTPPTGNAGTGE
jgi:hypothetical protein